MSPNEPTPMTNRVDIPPPHFHWPVVDEGIMAAVQRQLLDSISIYDRSGVFERFERRFGSDHARAHAVLFNSGTSALLAAYHAIGLGPGDEVICADYGFFATVGPLHMLGATGVL